MANPKEVNFSELSLLTWMVHTIPDALENRSKERDACFDSNEYRDLRVEDVTGGVSEGSVHVYLW